MQKNGSGAVSVAAAAAAVEMDKRNSGGSVSDSWAKLLASTSSVSSSSLSNVNTTGLWSSYGMVEGNMNSGSGRSGERVMFQTDSFPCGPFTRLLDPSANISPETLDLGLEEFPTSSGSAPVAASSISMPQLQVHLQGMPPSMRPPVSFASSNVLTCQNTMKQAEPAHPNPRQKHSGAGSPSSSSSTSSNNTLQKSAVEEGGECTTEQKRRGEQIGRTGVSSTSNTSSKRSKIESSGGPMKVRKEKLGERINALQQLVSPYGKTDTASVLQEAMGYIKFLQDQVQVLSTPYLKGLPTSQTGGRGDQAKYDLRSRGLCLVPVSCTMHVANNNGADFWTSGIGSNSKF